MSQKGKSSKFKAAAVLTAVLLLVLCACAPGNNNTANNSEPSGQEGNTVPSNEAKPDPVPSGNEAAPDETVPDAQKLYDQLKKLCDEALGGGEGELTATRTYSVLTNTPGGYGWVSEGTDAYTTSFYTDKDGRVEMVRLISRDGSAAREGELQYKGVKYKYSLEEHQDGSVEWREGAAEAGCITLPVPEALLFELPAPEELDSIVFEYSSYKLSVGRAYFRILTEDKSAEPAYYTLEDVKAEYYLDEDGKLSSCSWTYSDSWSTEGVSVTENVTAEVTLEKDRNPMPSTWFRDSSTYVRPEYPEITETAREAHFNLPGKIVFDVRIPKIKDGLPGADALNGIIERDLDYELTMNETLLAAQEFDYYTVRRADYSVIKLGKNYEILVDCSLGSAEGSGAATWGHRYFYVPDKGGMVSPETFLGMMGYDRESFLAAADADEYYTDYSENKMTEDFSYEELLGMFYFDQNAELIFVPDLMF